MKTFEDRIEINPRVMVGKPVIRGTRITVEYILQLIEQGWPIDKIVKEHPRLAAADVLAALNFARKNLEEIQIYPLPDRYEAAVR